MINEETEVSKRLGHLFTATQLKMSLKVNFLPRTMLSTDATKFSKKEGDSIGKEGKDLAKRRTENKMAFHLRVRDMQEQINEPHLTTQTEALG